MIRDLFGWVLPSTKVERPEHPTGGWPPRPKDAYMPPPPPRRTKGAQELVRDLNKDRDTWLSGSDKL